MKRRRRNFDIELIERLKELLERRKNKDWYAFEDFEKIYRNYGLLKIKQEILKSPNGTELWLDIQKTFIN